MIKWKITNMFIIINVCVTDYQYGYSAKLSAYILKRNFSLAPNRYSCLVFIHKSLLRVRHAQERSYPPFPRGWTIFLYLATPAHTKKGKTRRWVAVVLVCLSPSPVPTPTLIPRHVTHQQSLFSKHLSLYIIILSVDKKRRQETNTLKFQRRSPHHGQWRQVLLRWRRQVLISWTKLRCHPRSLWATNDTFNNYLGYNSRESVPKMTPGHGMHRHMEKNNSSRLLRAF